MASWTSGNPVSIGDPTKKSHGDVYFDNGQFERNASTGAILATLLATFNTGIIVGGTGTATFNTGVTLGGSLLTAGNIIQSTDAALPIIIGTGAGDDFTINTTGFTYSGDTARIGMGIGTPDGTLHVHTATAGSVTATTLADDLIVENSTNGGISILTPASTDGSINFGNPNNNDDFRIVYAHGATANTGAFSMLNGAGIAFRITATRQLSSGGETSPDVDGGGLCLQQGSGAGNLFTLKSSDVAHGVTSIEETDTFASIKKASTTQGGLRLQSISEGGFGTVLTTVVTSEDTTDTAASFGAHDIRSSLKSGTGSTTLGATANIFAVRNSLTTRFLIKGNGDIHATNTTITALDDHNDAEAVRDLTYHLAPKKWLSRALRYKKQELHDMGVITIDPNSDDIMMSFQGMFGLYGGAIGEIHGVVNLLAEKLKQVGITTDYNKLRKEFRANQPALLS